MAKGVKTGGRKAGTPNRENRALREMILAALNEQPGGGVEYLKVQAVESPAAFMTLLGKVLPTTLAGDPNAPLRTIQRIELVALTAATESDD